MPIDYPPPQEKQKDKEIRIPAIRNMTAAAVGAAILIIILVAAWWIFFRNEETNQNTNQAAADSNTKTEISEVLTQGVIDKFSEAEYGFKFEKHNDVEGYENQIGMSGADVIQIFSTDGVVAQVSYTFKVDNEQIIPAQIAQTKEFAGFMTDEDFANWVEEHIIGGAPNNTAREYTTQAAFYDGSLYSRVRYDNQGNSYWGSVTLAYNRKISDNSTFNFDYIGEDEEEPLEPFLPEDSLF